MKTTLYLFLLIFSSSLTAQSFHLVKDLSPGLKNSHIEKIAQYEDELLFSIRGDVNDIYYIYYTDGSEENTLKLLPDAIVSYSAINSCQSTDRIFLHAYNYPEDVNTFYSFNKLTKEIIEIAKIQLIGYVSELVYFEDKIYFISENNLYKLNPADGVTQMVIPDSNTHYFSNLTIFKNKIYFLNDLFASNLFEYDGTLESIKQISFDYNFYNYSKLGNLIVDEDKMYFSLNPGVNNGNEKLFVTDGTPENTFLLAELTVNQYNPTKLYQSNNKLYFTGKIVGQSGSLNVTDGSQEETKNVDPDFKFDFLYALTPFNNKSYLQRNDKIHYTTGDGIISTTIKNIKTLVGSFNDSLYMIQGSNFIAMGDDEKYISKAVSVDRPVALTDKKLYYISTDGIHGSELWVAENTALNIEKVPGDLQIDCWPNPASNYLNVKLASSENSIFNFKIIDVKGAIILTDKLRNSEIDISSLLSGSYFIELSTANKLYKSRFVKQ